MSDIGSDDSERIWRAIAAAVLDAPVSTVRDRAPHGVVCGVEVELTINNDRTVKAGRKLTPLRRSKIDPSGGVAVGAAEASPEGEA